jgi:hypothetical protein
MKSAVEMKNKSSLFRRFFIVAFLWVLCTLGHFVPAIAQNYRFSVPQMDLEVFVQPDASVLMKYRIVFENDRSGHPIDIVDIGLPHRSYQISDMSASIDGRPLNDIRKSSYIDIGVEVHLKNAAIAPGNSGVFEFQCRMPDMVYRDTTDKSYASLQVVPTWFDAQAQQGRTRLQAAIHMRPEVDPEQIKYQNEQYRYTDLVLYGEGAEKHPVAIWQYDSLQLSSNNPKLAVSFPQTGMDRVVSLGPFGLFMKWFKEHPEIQIGSMVGLLGVLGFTFFRFSHGTGFVLFVMLAGATCIALLVIPELHLAFWPGSFGLLFLNESLLSRKKHSASYLPAMATVEGGGIKRGLTAPQAAVLLELPMSKVLTLVIFGLMKKGVLEKLLDDPLQVEVAGEFQVPRTERIKTAGDQGIVLHDYEHSFLDRLMTHSGPVKTCNLNESMGGLVKSVVSRMAGFDLKETQAYYRAIIKRAWTEAESLGEVEQRDEALDRSFEWILMDENWQDIFDRWSRRGYRYRPRWDRRPRSGRGPVIISGGGGGSIGLPNRESTPTSSRTSLGEVAASFVGWTENTMGGLASAIEPAKMGLDVPRSGGILDLSSVDRVTANVFQALAESSAKGGGGSRGGGCACACAGCACACACAGGGR